MKKNKQEKDKIPYKELLILILVTVALGTVVGTILINLLSTIMSFELSFPIQILLGFLGGGGTLGTTMGILVVKSLKNDGEEFVEYEGYDLEDKEDFEMGKVQKKNSSLKIVKDSGSNYSYKFNDSERPQLEIVNSEKKGTRKR